MTGNASLRTARLRLGGLALTSLAAGLLPWIMTGPLVARLLGIPFLLIGVFCSYATYRLPAVASAANQRTAAYPAEPTGGCACGEGGGCCGGAPAEIESVEIEPAPAQQP
jgi:hypothetical protein